MFNDYMWQTYLNAGGKAVVDIFENNLSNEKDNLMDMLVAYVKEHPEVDIEIIVPHRENMERLLKEL